ncbi:unannotated protein [freshwater metagenome]|uniref:Unannotated protein n=1 Tax=freshwater metagenome TaxID=449393 RepID=A0A6J6ZL75_9ZZZZ
MRLDGGTALAVIICSIASTSTDHALGSSGRSSATSLRVNAASNTFGLLTANCTYACPIASKRSTDLRLVLLPMIPSRAANNERAKASREH